MTHNEISGIILDVAIQIHKALGPGLLESIYARVLEHELVKRGLRVEREVTVPVVWDGMLLDGAFRADLIVEGLVLIELKACEENSKVHRRQVITYLRLTGKKLGILLNFGLPTMREGHFRLVNGLDEQECSATDYHAMPDHS